MFLTAEQIRKVRLNGSKQVAIDGTDKPLRLIKLSGAAALEVGEIQKAVEKGERTRKEMFLFLLAHAFTDDSGEPLTAEDAEMLFDLLPIQTISNLVNQVTASINAAAEKPGKA
jgi:hypothetical protein